MPKMTAAAMNAADLKWVDPPPEIPKGAQLAVLQGDPAKKGRSRCAGATLTGGGLHFLPGKAHHAAETKGETIVQVTGIGPFDIHYLNPKDNPAKSAAVKP